MSGTVAADGTPYYGASSTASATVTVPAKASYSVTYNANGGSGAPSSQTKWHGETLTLSTTKPTRSGYTFLGWSTSSTATSATYAAGGSYTANSAATLYAVWKAITYSVTYNANGGSGAPGTQTKTYGVTLTLSSTKPTRTGYTFQGWATSSTGSVAYAAGANYTANAALALYAVWKANTYAITYNANKPSAASGSVTNMPASQTKTYGVTLKLSTAEPVLTNYSFQGWATSASGSVAYAAGANYTDNQARTLYAVWVLTYVAPTLTNLTAIRCDSDGTPNDEGTYCKLTLTWTNGNYAPTKVVFKVGSTSQTVTVTSGTTSATKVMGTFSAEQRFTVTATLTDGAGKSYTRSTILTPSFFTLDFLSGGKGIAIGQAAVKAGLDIAMGTYHESQSVHLVSGNITSGTAPSSTAYGNAYLYFRDSAEAQLGFIHPMFYASGTQSIRFYASRRIDSTTYYNGFRIGLTASGDPDVGFHNTACRDAWLDALGIGAIGLKDSLAASDIGSGTLALARGGTASDNTARAINTVFAGPSSGSAGNASWRKLVAADIPNLNTSKLTAGTLGIARGGTGSSTVVSVLANTTRTVLAWGPLVMVQLHGATGTPSATATLNTNTLASYKPAYNVSAIVADTSGHLARLWVEADTGSIRLAAVNYTSSSSWYGTLVYMRVPS